MDASVCLYPEQSVLIDWGKRRLVPKPPSEFPFVQPPLHQISRFLRDVHDPLLCPLVFSCVDLRSTYGLRWLCVRCGGLCFCELFNLLIECSSKILTVHGCNFFEHEYKLHHRFSDNDRNKVRLLCHNVLRTGLWSHARIISTRPVHAIVVNYHGRIFSGF